MATKSNLGASVPKPANQGGHSSSDATTQKVKIQPKAGVSKPGASSILYTKQPSGTKGSNKGAK